MSHTCACASQPFFPSPILVNPWFACFQHYSNKTCCPSSIWSTRCFLRPRSSICSNASNRTLIQAPGSLLWLNSLKETWGPTTGSLCARHCAARGSRSCPSVWLVLVRLQDGPSASRVKLRLDLVYQSWGRKGKGRAALSLWTQMVRKQDSRVNG